MEEVFKLRFEAFFRVKKERPTWHRDQRHLEGLRTDQRAANGEEGTGRGQLCLK